MTTSSARPTKAHRSHVFTATVLNRDRLSPSFARLTLGGEGLAGFDVHGFDQWFRMFIPKPFAGGLALPTADEQGDWYAAYRSTAEAERPTMRYVTVRDHRRTGDGGLELNVDVVVHGVPGDPGSGPLSTWAQTAAVGDAVGLLDQGLIFRPDLAKERAVLVGDETALPAIARILAYLPRDAAGHAFIEVPSAEDKQPLDAPERFQVTWLSRAEGDRSPGAAALAAALAVIASQPDTYVYGAGETRMTTELSRVLRQDLARPKDAFTTVGYWHHAPAHSV